MNKNLYFLVFIAVLVFSPLSNADDMTTAINNMYYHLGEDKLVKFNCEVTTDVFEQTKKQIYWKLSKTDKQELDSMKLYLSYENTNLKFWTSKEPDLSNKQINQEMAKVIDGTNKVVTSFFKIWGSLVFQPIFNESFNYIISDNENNRKAYYKQDGKDVEVIFNKDYFIQQITYTDENQITTIFTPKFLLLGGVSGIVITEMDFNIGNGGFKEHMQIKYLNINNMCLPGSVNIKIKTYSREQNILLKLSNYSVN